MSSPDDQPPVHNTRSAIQIVWSCLFIIFTCTWTAIHPNVPPAEVSSSEWRKRWWRIKIMLWTLILPEMMVNWAAYQWKKARKISTEAPKQLPMWSISARPTDGAHNQTSGLLSTDASSRMGSANVKGKPPATAKWTRTHSYFLLMGGFSVPDTGAKGLWTRVPVEDVLDGTYPWPAVKEADILNLTKGEALAKTIVVLQVIWFVSQLCGRVIQHLAITELEIMTLAYAIICAMLYMLWFNKPYDVQRPIFLDKLSYHPLTPESEPLKFHLFLSGLWLWPIHGRIVGDNEFSKHFIETDFMDMKAQSLALFISATLFGGIHLLAWNFEFPSQLELMMWRISSLCVSSIPLAFALLMGFAVTVINFLDDKGGILGVLGGMFGLIHGILAPILHNAYLIARIILFVQSFLLLRNLSPSATQAVSWASFFPHI